MTLRHIPAPLPLILASTSPFRKSVLSRLPIPFETFAPAVDETARPEERPAALVSRLAELKAKSAKTTYPQALIIGSDQVAVIDDTLLGKPGNHEQAVKPGSSIQSRENAKWNTQDNRNNHPCN